MSVMQNDNRWRIIAQNVSATTERRADGKYVASTGDSFSIANTPREAVAELFDVPPCDVIDPCNDDARALALVLGNLADAEAKKLSGVATYSVAILGQNYLQLLRAFQACASGDHGEALRRFADTTNKTADEIRSYAK